MLIRNRMKQTFMQAAYEKGRGWVKNANRFVQKHPLAFGLAGGALYAANRLAAGPTNLPSRGQNLRIHHELHQPAHMLRRDAYASSNTFSDRPVLLGNMRGI